MSSVNENNWMRLANEPANDFAFHVEEEVEVEAAKRASFDTVRLEAGESTKRQKPGKILDDIQEKLIARGVSRDSIEVGFSIKDVSPEIYKGRDVFQFTATFIVTFLNATNDEETIEFDYPVTPMKKDFQESLKRATQACSVICQIAENREGAVGSGLAHYNDATVRNAVINTNVLYFKDSETDPGKTEILYKMHNAATNEMELKPAATYGSSGFIGLTIQPTMFLVYEDDKVAA